MIEEEEDSLADKSLNEERTPLKGKDQFINEEIKKMACWLLEGIVYEGVLLQADQVLKVKALL